MSNDSDAHLQFCIAEGLLEVRPDGDPAGDEPLTRGEAAVALARLWAKLQTELGRGERLEER